MPNAVSVRVLQGLLRRQLEELRVARVRARPAALDVGEADLVELVQDAQAVLDRVRQVGLLRAVAQRGVVQLDAYGRLAHAVAPSTTRSPTSRGREAHLAGAHALHLARGGADPAVDPRGRLGLAQLAQQHLHRADRGERVDRALAGLARARCRRSARTSRRRPGLMLPPAAMPMPPWIMAPRSVMMSPNMLSVTITSNRAGESRK